MKIKTILVGLDSDDIGQTVFDQAVELAQATQASLTLCSVLAPVNDNSLIFSPYSDRDWATYADRYRAMERTRLETLETFANRAQGIGINAESILDMGSPGPVICKLAKTQKTDLIIVGSHGRQGLSEMLLGSVSNYVVHHATCSVMVVHGQT